METQSTEVNPEDVEGSAVVEETESEEGFGCEHYRRKCQFWTPCCQKLYTCRFCHDEKEEHVLNRRDVSNIQCLKCSTVQEIQQTCCGCGIVFGQYFCPICKLFDDEDKRQYHCDGCGICRIGGREKFYHCSKCDMCLPVRMENKHTCIEKVSRANCPVCLEDLHTSRVPSYIPFCGHLVHRNCFEDLLRTGNYACPICSVSMVDMTPVWSVIDNEIQNTSMPRQYMNRHVWVLCRDCHKVGNVVFHVLGLKCKNCGSYNTCRTKPPDDAHLCEEPQLDDSNESMSTDESTTAEPHVDPALPSQNSEHDT